MSETAAAAKYEDPRAHALRARYLATFGGAEIPVPVESIAEDLLGLRIEERWDLGDCSGLLVPAERLIVLNAAERASARNDPPLRRFRFTIAHELGHWICHAHERAEAEPVYCRQVRPRRARRPRARARGERVRRRAADAGAGGARGVGSTWEIDRCAAASSVSGEAMHWRLYSFGLGRREPQGGLKGDTAELRAPPPLDPRPLARQRMGREPSAPTRREMRRASSSRGPGESRRRGEKARRWQDDLSTRDKRVAGVYRRARDIHVAVRVRPKRRAPVRELQSGAQAHQARRRSTIRRTRRRRFRSDG